MPGRKPGTSTSVSSGMLKASQKRTKFRRLARGVDIEAAGQHHRLIGDHADGLALDADEAGEDVAAKASPISWKSPSSAIARNQFAHVIGLGRAVGISVSNRPSSRLGSSWKGRTGGFSRLFERQKSKRSRILSSASMSLSKAPSATEDFVTYGFLAPPRSSAVTISLVTVFTTSGPSRTCRSCRAP